MKRALRKGGILSALLAAVLLVAGCGVKTTDATDATEAPDAKSMYTSAIEQTQKLESMDCSIDMDMAISYGTQSMDITMDIDMQAENVSSAADLKMYMNTEMDLGTLGSGSFEMYYGDGYIYSNSLGYNAKAAVSPDQFDTTTQGVIDVSADLLSDLKMEEDGDNTIVSYSCSGTAAAELMKKISSVGSSSGAGTEGMYDGMSLESAEGTIVINKDGYVTSQTLNMIMKYAISGSESESSNTESEGSGMENAYYDIKMVVTYNNPGKDVTVKMPDASDYTEVDASDLGYEGEQ